MRQLLEPTEQEVPRQQVQPEPLRPLVGHHDRRFAHQQVQLRFRIHATGDCFEELGVEVVQDGDAHQVRGDVRRQPRQQRFDEVFLQRAVPRGQVADRDGRIGLALDRRDRQLQAERPALGDLVQSCALVQAQAWTQAPLLDLDRFFQAQAQVLGRQRGVVALGAQFGRLQRQSHARTDRDVQVRRRVQQQVLERIAHGRRGQPLRVVDHDDRLRAARCDLRQHPGQRFHMRLARQPLIAANAARAAQRVQQRHRETGRIVLVVRGQPGDRRALFQPALPPLQQQRRLAEAGGRDR